MAILILLGLLLLFVIVVVAKAVRVVPQAYAGVVERFGKYKETLPAGLVGAHGLVTESIAAHAPGRVKIGGENWLAVSPGAEAGIEAGRTVEVIEIVGATAHVRPVFDSPR